MWPRSYVVDTVFKDLSLYKSTECKATEPEQIQTAENGRTPHRGPRGE